MTVPPLCHIAGFYHIHWVSLGIFRVIYVLSTSYQPMCNVRLHSYHHFHYLLQVLNISGNNVPLFGRNHFARLGLTNLQRVAASRCGLVQIDGLAFIGLTNLVELDLSLNQLAEVSSTHYTKLWFLGST